MPCDFSAYSLHMCSFCGGRAKERHEAHGNFCKFAFPLNVNLAASEKDTS
jgi:hypothetical protein